VPPASLPEIRSLLRLAVFAIVVAALYVGQTVIIPLTLAVMLSFVLSPLVNGLRRLGLWRTPSVIASVLLSIGVIGLGGTMLGSQAATLAIDAPHYAQTIQQKVQGIQAIAASRLAAMTSVFGALKPPGGPVPSLSPAASPGRASSSSAAAQRRPVLVELAQPETSAMVVARALLEPVLAPLETTVIVLVVAIFILLQQDDLRDRFIRVFGSSDLHRTTVAMDEVGHRLSRYFVSQLGVNASFGLVIGLGLLAIGVPSPALWGVTSGLLRFVPYLGPVIAAVAPLSLAAAVDPGWLMASYVGLLFLIVEPLTGYVVEPLLYGHSTGLSPVSVIVAAVFWTWIWGPIGLILSTPLTLCLIVMGRHVKSLEFFDVLLGDRAALSPVEVFYQRILADNPDEALDKAEAALATRSLLDYYDGVVLEGLKLAAEDEARGTIDRRRAAELTNSMLTVIGDLDDHVDAAKSSATPGTSRDALESVLPPPAGLVACVAGRGPFDEAVSAMLAQLLRQRGRRTVQIPHAAVSRYAAPHLDVTEVRIFVLSYLTLTGSPTHVRYLIKRLRQQAPDAMIVVGLWPASDALLVDPALQRAVGADRYVVSLRQAVDTAIELPTHQPTARVPSTISESPVSNRPGVLVVD
jgi:predicted PurR-regulated permease PerM